MDTKTLGNIGEKYAQKFLISKNYQIIKTNFHARFGEIDIIAIDYSTSQPQLSFIEVKTRTTTEFGLPKESITYQKKQKIIKTALYFLNSSTLSLPFSWRIDVIGIQLDKKKHLKEINHFKNIING